MINQWKQYKGYIILRIIKGLFRKVGVVFESFYLLNNVLDKDKIDNKFKTFDFSDVEKLDESHLSKLNFIDEKKKQLFKVRLDSANYSSFVCIKGNEIAYFTWISWNSFNYPSIFDKTEKLNNNQALLEDSFCHPDYRGQGYHSKMNVFRLKEILKHGKNEALVLILKENRPAMKVQLKSGFKVYKKLRFIKIKDRLIFKEKKM